MVMREWPRVWESSPRRCFFSLFFLALVLAVSACRPSLHDMGTSAEERITSETNRAKMPIAVPEVSKPMLVIDVTLSMAGYFAPPEQRATEFGTALDALSGALPGHDLYTFGDRRAEAGSSLQRLLMDQPSGIGRAFYRVELFAGQFNQDDLLFQAVGRQPRARPLVFVTDGVYSTPQGKGIQPVFQALDGLLARGWSLGIIALRSTYYGTRCGLIPGRPCAEGSRLFFSEARSQRGMAQFFRMPPCAVPARPFYVMVLAPTSATFKDLAAKLHELRPAATFLISGDAQPVKIGPPRAFGKAGEEPPGSYGTDPKLKWLMLDAGGRPHPEIAIEYSVTPEFPVGHLRWEVRAERVAWERTGFGAAWGSASTEDVVVEEVSSSGSPEGPVAAATPPVLLWNGFDREILDLQASFRHIRNLGDLADRHPAAMQRIESWRPAATELGPLYCDYLGQRHGVVSNEKITMLNILLAVDALRRQQPGEVTATYGPEGGDLAALAKDLANFSPRRTSLASGVSLPAGNPKVFPAEERQGESGPVGGRQIILRLSPPPEARTYRLHLAPRPLLLSRSLNGLTTNDDSDMAFADRTYRLGTLIEALSAAQLERIGQRGDLTVYVTVPGR